MRHTLFCASFGLALIGCATPPVETAANKDAATDCIRTYRVGSMIPTYRCAAEQTEAQRQQEISELQKTLLRSGGTKTPAGGGG